MCVCVCVCVNLLWQGRVAQCVVAYHSKVTIASTLSYSIRASVLNSVIPGVCGIEDFIYILLVFTHLYSSLMVFTHSEHHSYIYSFFPTVFSFIYSFVIYFHTFFCRFSSFVHQSLIFPEH